VLDRLKSIGGGFKRQLAFYRRVIAHPRTPRFSRFLLAAAVAYALLPFDLIPDFIPVLGHLDDLVIIPLLVIAAMRLVPADVLEECRNPKDSS